MCTYAQKFVTRDYGLYDSLDTHTHTHTNKQPHAYTLATIYNSISIKLTNLHQPIRPFKTSKPSQGGNYPKSVISNYHIPQKQKVPKTNL